MSCFCEQGSGRIQELPHRRHSCCLMITYFLTCPTPPRTTKLPCRRYSTFLHSVPASLASSPRQAADAQVPLHVARRDHAVCAGRKGTLLSSRLWACPLVSTRGANNRTEFMRARQRQANMQRAPSADSARACAAAGGRRPAAAPRSPLLSSAPAAGSTAAGSRPGLSVRQAERDPSSPAQRSKGSSRESTSGAAVVGAAWEKDWIPSPVLRLAAVAAH